MRDLGKLLLITGGVLVVLGLVLTFAGRTPLGRLPGDILYKRGNFTLYIPLLTSLLLSLLLTLLFWLFRR